MAGNTDANTGKIWTLINSQMVNGLKLKAFVYPSLPTVDLCKDLDDTRY